MRAQEGGWKMTEKAQSITYKTVVGGLTSVIIFLGYVVWFFLSGFYQSTLEVQKSLQEIKLSMVKIQAEMLTEERVRQIVRYEMQLNSKERN